jgi:hypothetical protein
VSSWFAGSIGPGKFTSVSTREERRAENEAIFRAGNEAIVHNVGNLPALPLICECGSAECVDQIHVTPEEYQAVRSHVARFLLATGHEDENETVLDEFDRFSVIEKTGDGRAVVEDRD